MTVLIKDLQKKLNFNGDTGIILGSGLGHLADELTDITFGASVS